MNWRAVFAAFAAIVFPTMAFAGWSGFLLLPGVSGESSDTNHIGWIDVSGVSGGLARDGTNASLQEYCFAKRVDKASPSLSLNCAKGILVAQARLDVTETNSSLARFFRINLTNVLITSVNQSGLPDEPRPSESICLKAQIVSWNYVQFSPTSGLPRNYSQSVWNAATYIASGTNSPPTFLVSGLRRATGSVELSWSASAGKSYRVFAGSSLTSPFTPIFETNAVLTGQITNILSAPPPAGFFVVEQLP